MKKAKQSSLVPYRQKENQPPRKLDQKKKYLRRKRIRQNEAPTNKLNINHQEKKT